MKRSNVDKIVAQIYLRDWSMKNEILRKAQMYEHTISNIEIRSNRNNADIKIFTPPSLHNDNVVLLKPHCNRSGVYVMSKGSANFCDIHAASSLKTNNKIRRKKILKLRKYKDIFNTLIAIDKL